MDKDTGEGNEVIAGLRCKVRDKVSGHLVDKVIMNTTENESTPP